MTEIPTTHSKLGIASFAVAVVMFLAFLLALLHYNLVFGSPREQPPWFSSPALNTLELVVLMVLPIPVHAVGFVLGAVSLFFPTRKKLFPLLGIALNGLFGFCGLIPWVWLALHAPGVK